jgi:hypothetical protein
LAAFAIVLAVLCPLVASAQASGAPATPEFRVRVWGDAFGGFMTRVDGYADLRRQLERELPAVVVTDDVRQLIRGQRALARAIRNARPGAVQGEFFTTATSAEFKAALASIMDARVWAAIMDDNPGAFRHDIDGTYREGRPFSTMPGVVLARLPPLPGDLEFRFLGRHLVLYDVRANTIVDRLPDAIGRRPADD